MSEVVKNGKCMLCGTNIHLAELRGGFWIICTRCYFPVPNFCGNPIEVDEQVEFPWDDVVKAYEGAGQ